MHISELAISGSFELTPTIHNDSRGLFFESFKNVSFKEMTGIDFQVAQTNNSISHKGAVRGIHFADIPPGQAKLVTCFSGAVLDFIVDVRVGSPTFGEHVSVLLDSDSKKSLYISEGLGHCFLALENNSTVSYQVSSIYSPANEHSISPLDSGINLNFGLPRSELLISEKDLTAPSLNEAIGLGLLPSFRTIKPSKEV